MSGLYPKRKVIFEVLPSSTERYDWRREFDRCRSANHALTDYVFILHEQPFVEHFKKRGDGEWLYDSFSEMSDCISVDGMGITVSLAEIYDRVVFPEPSPETDGIECEEPS